MKNIPLSPTDYQFLRDWLRTQDDVIWRDLRTSLMIPKWGEAPCNSDFLIGDLTCAQVAYQALTEEYPGLSLRWLSWELDFLDWRPPMFFVGAPIRGQIGYIDLKAAYWTFYRYLFLHSKFPFKRQQYPLQNVASLFNGSTTPQWKIARNAVIGITRSTRNKWCQGPNIWFTKKKNKYLSPTLWAQLMGLLNQIAQDMMALPGCAYINTDGYAFTDLRAYHAAISYFTDRDLVISGGIGEGFIDGINSVHIPGVKETKELIPSKPVFRMMEVDVDFYSLWNNNRKDLQ